MVSLNLFKVLIFCFFYVYVVMCKECTNTPTELSSHTYRYALLSSSNETWKNEMFSHYDHHLTPTDDDVWSNLLPRKMLKEEEEEYNWVKMYRNMKYEAAGEGEGEGFFLKEVSLNDVKLDPDSFHGHAQQTNLEYLLMLDVDNLVWSFRKTAGLSTPGTPYGGWESPNTELRGHFVGHYLSASSKMWASTNNETLKEKMFALVSALSACQEKIGNGYLSAFPSELFDRFEAIKPVWAPYYTIHKIMAGLVDMYKFAGNNEALNMVKLMAGYFFNRVQNVIQKYSVERHYLSLNEETGGMNDVLYNLYSITGDPQHLLLAHLFDKPCFLGLLALKADDISGFHSNTHIPIVIGAQRRYEITGDPLYKDIGTFFMNIVNSSHSYATGGTSVSEFWSDPKRLASTLTSENEESCTTYNMLKVSRTLFRWTKEMSYADYYERALTNGVLSIQRGKEPGIMIYMLPMQRGGSKAHSYHGWGTKFNSFWCCYGTAIESFSKLGDSIYFEEEGNVLGLYIIQYISSSFDWKSGKIKLSQKVEHVVSWDSRLQVTLTIDSIISSLQSTTLNLRIPTWAYGDNSPKASLNDQDLSVPMPGNFLSITKKWSTGDKIVLELPLSLRSEPIKDDRQEYASIQALLYGPYLLAGLSFGEWDIETERGESLSDWIIPIPKDYNSNLISLLQESGTGSVFFLAKTNKSINMVSYSEAGSGTDVAANSTFRLIPQEQTSRNLVMLEPYNLPGTVLVHQGKDEELAIEAASGSGKSSLFYMIPGLDENNGTISLESIDQTGCYIYSNLVNTKQSGATIKLSCSSNSSDTESRQAVSFKLTEGLSKYHPISFIAKGKKNSFLLSPLLSLRDESYTVYFNLKSSAA